jgi:urease accessory protein
MTSGGSLPRGSEAFLAALQLADSLFPYGRFVHSYGIEAWLESNQGADEEDLAEVIGSLLTDGVGPLDCCVITHAHAATSIEMLLSLDNLLTARKLVPGSRLASHSCGRQLAALASALVDDPLLEEFCVLVSSGRSIGNLAVVEGTFSRALGLRVDSAVLIELRGTANACLSAAVRLGRLTGLRAQVILRRLESVMVFAAERSVAMDLRDLRSTIPELEICAMAHPRSALRLFAT